MLSKNISNFFYHIDKFPENFRAFCSFDVQIEILKKITEQSLDQRILKFSSSHKEGMLNKLF